MSEEKNNEFSAEKREYLALIQEPIGRMSTASSIYKGFASTIVSGIAALSYANIHTAILILSFLPVLSFAALDIYYLRIERLFRGLYSDVLTGRHSINYVLQPNTKDKEFIRRAKAQYWRCLLSPSFWLFYPCLIVILIIVCVLKMRGVC